MLIYLHKERIKEAVKAIHREAAEARGKGDYSSFFELSHKALELVNDWANSHEKERNGYINSFETSLKPKDENHKMRTYDFLDMVVTKTKLRMNNNFLKVV